MKRVAIIGTAGHTPEDAKRMTPSVYRAMCKEAMRILRDEWKLEPPQVCLISGGSSWTDHVAVELYLASRSPLLAFAGSGVVGSGHGKFGGLVLHMPCPFSKTTSEFETKHACGKKLNDLHRSFSFKCKNKKRDATLDEIGRARLFGATINSDGGVGMLTRNTRVAADAEYLIAFTWSDTDVPPAKSGTADTWNKAKTKPTQRRHVKLASLVAAPAQAAAAAAGAGAGAAGVLGKRSVPLE